MIVDYDREAKVVEQSLDGAKVDTTDLDHNVFQFAVDPPWPPGEKRSLVFSTDRSNIGFRNQGNISGVIANGTFLNNGDGMPLIGFNGGKLIQARNVRRRYGRAPLPRAYKLEDERFWRTNSLRPDSDWVTFTTTVSTVVDQIAIAPGYLAREWEADGRRYFRYEMDRPIQNFFSFQSADYKVLEEEWNGIKLQVFYHEAHTFNVDRIMTAMRESLDYFSQAFSPFQYRQMRILEFPAYASFAQSFANTVPFSESIGYVLDLRDAKSFDVAYYVTAHEVAHQWWGHQIVPSAVQGGTMVVETFAQYGALLAVEKKYGPHQMRRFLGYELDAYLRGRASEPEAERPLYRVENQQYIHYRKGAVVMYELRDRLGEDVVNRSLA
ncbi:MAG: M1 family aminopeptidase, partial [Myxococcota bacterium]